jgi:predicted metal-dependent hydrolase
MEIRDRSFALDEVPRKWHAGGRAVTAFFDNLSIFFPAGERFFIASVAAQRRRVSDPGLQQLMREFIQQEAFHTREHLRYNRRLRELGYPVDAMEGRVERLLALVSRRPARSQLAATCALEHFTALLARGILEDPEALRGAHPEMAALWRWHATEEHEHRAVAFDVYRAAGGTWLERSLVMLSTTLVFWGKVLEQQLRMMRADGIVSSPREWLSLGHFLMVRPGPLRRLVLPYLAYYRRSFHPCST